MAAIQAYRHLLRSARVAFEGDAQLYLAAAHQAGAAFRANATLSPDDAATQKAIKHAEEVSAILRQNIVQGQKTEGGEDKYRLKIREETERGDNDTVKMPNGQKIQIDGKKCCSS